MSKLEPKVEQPELLSAHEPRVQFLAQQYSGNIPPPELLVGFDRAVPGSAARIVQWAEDEAQHRRNLESRAQSANISAQDRELALAETTNKRRFYIEIAGLIAGLLAYAACIGGAIYLGLKGREIIATALAALPTAAVIYAFRGHLARPEKSPDQ